MSKLLFSDDELLELYLRGLNDVEIAKELNSSQSNVCRRRIKLKLKANYYPRLKEEDDFVNSVKMDKIKHKVFLDKIYSDKEKLVKYRKYKKIKANKRYNDKKIIFEFKCKGCGKLIMNNHNNRKYCSVKCRSDYNNSLRSKKKEDIK